MADWKKISKEEFDAAYNAQLPSGWIRFAFKYFSKETEKKDMAVKNTVVYVLGGLFLLGMIATMLNLSNKVVGMFVIPYGILLAALVFYLFSAVFLNNRRISKICKKLGVTKWEYNLLVDKFYS